MEEHCSSIRLCLFYDVDYSSLDSNPYFVLYGYTVSNVRIKFFPSRAECIAQGS
jgi:hypothetical protein